MRAWVGTSGFQYDFWRGNFYPEDCKKPQMLAAYGERLRSVEINVTFYRMPKRAMLEGWATQVPDRFRFALKASRRITHMKRLKEVEEPVAYLVETVRALGDRLGPLLFQLPPNLEKNTERLEGLLALLPRDVAATLEFRHPSWFDDEVYGLLREHGVALCISDQGEGEDATPFESTSSFGYLRLRRDGYSDDELSTIAERIRAQGWNQAYAYFKHEQLAPTLAARLSELLA
jgi:uncharacterized protein YecE (DUF72 family)